MEHPRFKASKLRAATWHYFQACLFFNSQKFKEANRALDGATNLLGDKMGWNIAFRLLEIMNHYELGNLDTTDAKIKNMRHYLRRSKKDSELYRAMELIYILLEWHKYGLNLELAMPHIQPRLNNLKEFHKEFPFNPNATELVRFEEWIVTKK